MDTHYLKITDKAAIEHSLEDETEYQFTGIITTRGKNTIPDEEGGQVITHKAQFTSHLTLIKGDKIIKGRDKGKKSLKLRSRIWIHGQELGVEDEERYYQEQMNKIITYYDEVAEFLQSKS